MTYPPLCLEVPINHQNYMVWRNDPKYPCRDKVPNYTNFLEGILIVPWSSPIWGEHMLTFKVDVCSPIGELMLGFSLLKVGICSPVLGEHIHI